MTKKIEISPYGNLLVYKKEYTLEFVQSTIQEKQLKGLRIFSILNEDKLSNLSFLSEYTFLEALDITSLDDYDFNFLLKLKGLKELTINTQGKEKIDLSNQVNLETLNLQWRKGKITGLENCQKLNSLCLIDFKENDFSAISKLSKLKELIVKTASIKSVNGLDNFYSLENLLLANCRSLKSIEAITALKGLMSLHIELCTKIEDYTFISHLSNLNKLTLTDCKEISSIKFVQDLHFLNELSLLGNTDVLDGDIIPAKNVKKVFYKHRKHYNIQIENKEYDSLIKSNLDKIKGFFK